MLAEIRWFFLLALAFAAVNSVVFAQDAIDDIRYKEDYDRIQQIIKTSNPARRADQIVTLYTGRPDLDPRLRDYVDAYFRQDMESLLKQEKYALVKKLSQNALAARPRFGETYLFLGVALKYEKKMDEAINAFARSYAIKSPLQTKAKQLLDNAYRSVHKGSLIGEDKVIGRAKEELKLE